MIAMITFLLFFTVCAVSVMMLILKFEKKQTVKVQTVMRGMNAVPPMMKLKSAEQKITQLKKMLRYDDLPKNMGDAASMASIYNNQNENMRLSKVQELKVLAAKYNNGQISLDVYSESLNDLYEDVQRHRRSFMMAG